MAVVSGLQNVSVFESSFLLESQSPASRQWIDHDRPSTQGSSILQMWRELEGEHVVSHPNERCGERFGRLGSETSDSDHVSTQDQGSVNGKDGPENSIRIENEKGLCSRSIIELENEDEDNNNFFSGQSTDLGEVERERVRQIFREWMKSGAKSHLPNGSHRNNCSRADWLGENECERVRIIREWVQMNAQHSGMCSSSNDDGVAEFDSQIAQVRDGRLVNQCEVAERRPIRKLCGRQALLDMLMRAQRERKKELRDISQCKPVSQFAHRNRIQSLLRGRFLLNRRLVQDERPASIAASELGLLKQRHTVSDLREGFLSKLDRVSVNDLQFDASSNDGNNDHRSQQFRSSIEPELQAELHVQSGPGNEQNEFNEIDTEGNVKCNAAEDLNLQENDSLVIEAQENVLEDKHQEEETSGSELISSRCGGGDGAPGSWREDNTDERSQRISDTEETRQTHLLEGCEMDYENDSQSIVASDVHSTDIHTYGLEASMTEDDEWQEPETENEDDSLQQFASHVISEWTEANGDGIDGRWQDDVGASNHLQESDGVRLENAQQEAIDSLLDVPSGQETDSVGRIHSFNFLHEENTQSSELRQLLGRRRVSTLLHSGFGDSLDQLLQSYIQSQNNASVDWELDESSSFIDLDQEQQHDNQDMDQPSWNQELRDFNWTDQFEDYNWPDLLRQSNWPGSHPQEHIGNEWEVINELRIDMVRLHQRMNNMQRMLEACMEMQLELQRSVRQEVSAALNLSVNISSDDASRSHHHCPVDDDIKLDHVRKGICCVCFTNNIDSVLYRCGHMCACSNCAEELVRGGRCPMCQAPIVEAIRAYFIQ